MRITASRSGTGIASEPLSSSLRTASNEKPPKRKSREPAVTLSSRAQLEYQVGFHRTPFRCDNAIYAGVAQRAVGVPHMAAKHSVEMSAEALDRPPARKIETGRPKLHRDAGQRFECVLQEHDFTYCIQRGTLNT